MNLSKIGSMLVVFGIFAFILAAIVGWASNIGELITGHEAMGVPEMLLRIAGVFFAPLGALLGWFV